jgi:hypothetical protein
MGKNKEIILGHVHESWPYLQPDNIKSILNVYRNPIQPGKKGKKDIQEPLGKKIDHHNN